MAETISSGYLIRQATEKSKPFSNGICGFRQGPAKYLLMKQDSSLRVYAGPDFYLSLVEDATGPASSAR
jgi:hypothetical protein